MMAMVTRWTLHDASGLVFTPDEMWSYDIDDALNFRHHDEAMEASALYPGSYLEQFQLYSPYPDFVPSLKLPEVAA